MFLLVIDEIYLPCPHLFVGEVNVCDDNLVFQNRSLSFLLITSCNVVFLIFPIYTTFQSEINKKG